MMIIGHISYQSWWEGERREKEREKGGKRENFIYTKNHYTQTTSSRKFYFLYNTPQNTHFTYTHYCYYYSHIKSVDYHIVQSIIIIIQ